MSYSRQCLFYCKANFLSLFLIYRQLLNPDREHQLTNDFLAYSYFYQQDLRAIGLILLQLIQRQVFTEKELKYWKTWTPTTEDFDTSFPVLTRPFSSKMEKAPELISRLKSRDAGDLGSVRSTGSKPDTISVLSGSDQASLNSSKKALKVSYRK